MVRRREFCRIWAGAFAGISGCTAWKGAVEPIDTASGDWSQFRGDRRRMGANTSTTSPSLTNGAEITSRIPKSENNDFRGTEDESYAKRPTEVVGTKDAYYVGERRGRLWSIPSDELSVVLLSEISGGFTSLVLGDRHLFAGTTNGIVRAIDAAGNTRERFDLPDAADTQVTHGGDFIVASTESNLYVLDPELTEVLWSTRVGDGRYYPAIDGRLVVIHAGSELHAYSAAGKHLWTASTNGYGETPVLGDDRVFLLSDRTDVTAFSRDDGSVTWQHRVDGEIATYLAAADRLYFVVGTGSRSDPPALVALSKSGKVAWRVALDATEPEYVSDSMSPVVCGESVYVATESHVLQYDRRSGRLQARDRTIETQYDQRGFPFVAHGRLGVLLWHFERGWFKLAIRS